MVNLSKGMQFIGFNCSITQYSNNNNTNNFTKENTHTLNEYVQHTIHFIQTHHSSTNKADTAVKVVSTISRCSFQLMELVLALLPPNSMSKQSGNVYPLTGYFIIQL